MDRLLNPIARAILACCLGLLVCVCGPATFAVAKDESLPDPTRPDRSAQKHGSGQAREEQPPPSWELSSVIRSPRRELAVINGRIRQVGDIVDGAKILEIKPDAVILRYRGNRRLIRLFSQETGLTRTGNEQGANKR